MVNYLQSQTNKEGGGEEEFESQPAIKKGAPRKLKKRCYYACQSQEGHISRDSFPPGNESNRDLRY